MQKQSLLDLVITQYPLLAEKEAFARILCGEVFVDGERVRDAGRKFDTRVMIEVKTKKYVSRGGNKLEPVLSRWNIEVRDKVFVDAGASTGGFTDCLLQRGAAMVHAVDVGYNQLDYSLRTDFRVKVYERTNIMSIHDLQPMPHAAVADLSFRKIRGAAGHLLDMVSEGWIIALVKPQYEIKAGMDPHFSGVVKSLELQEEILCMTAESLKSDGVDIAGVVPSSITGRKGNREYFFYLLRASHGMTIGRNSKEMIRDVVYGD